MAKKTTTTKQAESFATYVQYLCICKVVNKEKTFQQIEATGREIGLTTSQVEKYNENAKNSVSAGGKAYIWYLKEKSTSDSNTETSSETKTE